MTTAPDVQLAKAAATLGRVAAFLDRHRTAQIDPAISPAASTVRDAASALAAMVRSRLPDGAQPGHPRTEGAPTGPLDPDRLQRFATYLSDLRRWFSELDDLGLSPPTVMHLEDLLGALQTIQDAVATLTAATDPEPVVAVHHRPAPPAGDSPRRTGAEDGDRMVFEHAPERPLLREVHGKAELTDAARELIAEFLAKHEISGGAAKHRLETRMLRWLEATPAGQVLVLKMGSLTDRPEPYPTYMAPDLAYGRSGDDEDEIAGG
jgi:hypothetical protein